MPQSSSLLQPNCQILPRHFQSYRQRPVRLNSDLSRFPKVFSNSQTRYHYDAWKILIKELEKKHELVMSGNLPPQLIDHITRQTIQQFQSHINKIIASMEAICVSCGSFLLSKSSYFLSKTNPIFQ